MFKFDYKKALYRRNNFGQPCVWIAEIMPSNVICVSHGILGKTITRQFTTAYREINDEIKSKINEKRKRGYKLLSELKDDNIIFPVEGQLLDYLNAYLPVLRTTADGSLLHMLATSYNNDNNRLYKKVSCYIEQWKINGERCFVSARLNTGDMFRKYRLSFQSRDGIYWISLSNLEDYLLEVIPEYFINRMIEEHIIIDGEVYLPGYSINQINHFIKDPKCAENKLLQFWSYDLSIDDYVQYERINLLEYTFNNRIANFINKEEHLSNKERFILLPYHEVCNDEEAILARDNNINLGFEGSILRNPNAEYQYGKRNLSMIKYKKSTDGKFKIIDVYSEGYKRPDIPLFLCKNDINDSTFEVHIGGSLNYQRECFLNKNKFIGKYMHVEFGERSGVEQVPFHVKTTYIIKDDI